MTQFMKEQLRALIDELEAEQLMYSEWIAERVRKILAASPPAVSVKPGWVCKDWDGLNWFGGRPEFSEYDGWGGTSRVALTYADADCVIDPWPDHPNGGPECCMEVKP